MKWFMSRVQPLKEQDVPDIARQMALITWNKEQAAQCQEMHVSHTSTQADLMLLQSQAAGKETEQALYEQLVSFHKAEATFAEERARTFLATAKVLHQRLTAWVAAAYCVDTKRQWHIDMEQKLLVCLPTINQSAPADTGSKKDAGNDNTTAEQ